MSVRKQLLFTAVLAVLTLLLTVAVLIRTNVLQEQLYHEQVARYDSYLLADELRQSSDDLTRLARTYVLTGDDKYEKMYWDILDIRNGKKARPEHMERIYWDLILSYGQKPRGDGDTISLNELKQKAGFTTEEFAKLTEAQNNSDGLVTTETIAMNALKGLYDNGSGSYTRNDTPDPEMAARIMHDSQYHADKAKIMAPVNEFLTLLDERTATAVGDLHGKVAFYQSLLMFCFITAILVIAGSLALLYRSVMKQLGGEPSELLEHIQHITNGDLSTNYSGSEVGILGGLKVMTEHLRETIIGVKGTAEEVSLAAGSLTDISSQTTAGVRQQSADVDMVAGAMMQMVTTANEVAQSAGVASTAVQDVNDKVQHSNTVVSKAVNNARELSVEVGSTVQVVDALRVESSNVGEVLNVIRDIADQTNLLALNAAIEAARAGEQGRGFAVVADEVRTLASRTQQSTTEIQDIISNLQDGAEKATVAMKKGQEMVEITVTDIESAGQNLVEISTAIAEIADQNTKIATAADQQRCVADEVTQNVTNISAVSEKTVEGAEQVADSSEKLSQMSRSLEVTVAKFST